MWGCGERFAYEFFRGAYNQNIMMEPLLGQVEGICNPHVYANNFLIVMKDSFPTTKDLFSLILSTITLIG